MASQSRTLMWLGIGSMIFLFCTAFGAGQTVTPTLESDLDEAAKATRQQREREKTEESGRTNFVNQMAKELADSDDGPISGAPIGYRYFYFKLGDYAILVPADAKPEARDRYGLRLFSEEAFTSRIEVILGEPILAEGKTPDEMIHNANATYFSGCGLNLSGLGPPVNGHPAHSAGFGNCSLHRDILGNAEFVVADAYVMPVVCGYPMTAEDWDPRPNQPIQRITTKYDRERRGFEVCSLILGSPKFHPYAGRWQLTIAQPDSQQRKTTRALLSDQNTETNPQTGEMSLGELARANKKTSAKELLTDLKHSASGYTPLNFRYFCTADNSVCYSASIEMPVAAKRNDQYVNPYTGLFQFTVPVGGRNMAIVQANTGVSSEPGVVSREEFIRTKADWWIGYSPANYYSAVGEGHILNEELTEIGGVPTRFATFRNATASGPVITHLAAYMVPGKIVQIRCSIPEEFSGDTQTICESILRSLEVPKPAQQTLDPDDPPTSESDRDDNDRE